MVVSLKVHLIFKTFASVIFTILLWCITSAQAAQEAPFDTSQFQDLAQILKQDTINSFVQTAGLVSMEREYQPASPIGKENPWELGASATLVKLSDKFKETLTSVGAPALDIPAVPMAYLQLHKGMGDSANLGVSYFKFKIFKSIAAYLQVTVLEPEEQPIWAVRLSYTVGHVGFITAKTLSPQVIVSRPLNFAEPYIGAGLAIISGEFTIVIPIVNIEQKVTGSSTSAYMFTGVKFKVPAIGLKLGIEGGYSTVGAHTLGLSTGIVF